VGAFEYTALDTAGREQNGVVEGDTVKHVRQLLRERQLLPVTVAEVKHGEAKRDRSFSIGRGVSASDLSLLTRQLATLVKAGLPLEEALLAVSQQSEKPRIQSIMLGVRSKVMEGHTLADGFSEFPKVFPEIYRSTVAAGESSGRLDGVLERLADYTENREVTRQKVLGAMLYPIVLSVICLGIVTGMMVYVVPKVIEVFESSKGKLPLATQVLIFVSEFLRNWGLYLALAIVATIVAFVYWLKNPDNRRLFHRFQLRLPLFGRLVRGFNTARFTRTFSILTASAVPVLEAMRIAGEVVTNLPMRDAVAAAAARVREGAEQVVPTHDGASDLVGRIERRTRQHARPRRDQPGARARLHDGRAGGPPGSTSHCCDGHVRHGHRFCNADADIRDEHFDSLNLDRISVLAIA
jgi:general secretion pathway protein F